MKEHTKSSEEPEVCEISARVVVEHADLDAAHSPYPPIRLPLVIKAAVVTE